MKLFAIYIGGEHPKAHIEVHDVRFVVAETITGTYDQLRAEWWGRAGSLHVDCWADISHVDGYDVTLERAPPSGAETLYFVNLGGYDGQAFAEAHKNLFVVAGSSGEAKVKALRSINSWKDAHKDDLYEAERVFGLDGLLGDGWRIHLRPNPGGEASTFTCRYTPLK